MKKFYYFILVFALLFVSCEKEPIEPIETQQEVVDTVEEEIRLYGEWLLIDAKMYVENMETY